MVWSYGGGLSPAPASLAGEVVFNTAMTGYQEVLTDPSYKGQIVTMTYPLMGNYGVNPEDIESRGIHVEGFIVKEYHPYPSNWRAQGNLADYLKAAGKLGVEGLDTRAITKRLREVGAMRGIISTLDLDPASLVRRARELPSMEGLDLVPLVTCGRPYWWPEFPAADVRPRDLAALWAQKSGKKVVLYDYGVKFNIIRNLKARGLEVLVVPATTPAAAVLALAPDGIILSNGPGDPAAVTYAVDNVRQCLGSQPMFGICLGHQLLGLALGGRTFKLKFGHRGANQPVKNSFRPGGDHLPESRLCRGPGVHPRPGGGADPRQPQRRHLRGVAPSRTPGLLGPVPPRGLPRPP